MLLPLAVCLINAVLVESFVLPESYSIVLKDRAEFKVDEPLDADENEMISDDELGRLRLRDKENDLDDLNRLASKEYQKTAARHWSRLRTRDYRRTLPKRTKRKSINYSVPPLTKQPLRKRDVTEDRQLNYEYNDILKEYYEESLQDGQSNETYHARKKGKSNELISSLEKLVPLDALKTLQTNAHGRNEMKTPQDTKMLVSKVWRFTKIMVIVYVAVAIPLWCTKGWCCCCLFCKVFKPRQTIDQAKKYLIRNPPGTHISNRGHEQHYRPTNAEKESYEAFEHLVRTM